MGLIDEKPMGIPYGIWVLIFCLSFTALSRVTWIPKLLYKNIEIETFIGFLTDNGHSWNISFHHIWVG